MTWLEKTIAMTSTAHEAADELRDPVGDDLARREPPATASPSDTAGLKWPPEMWPNAVIASASPKPKPAAIPSGEIASVRRR